MISAPLVSVPSIVIVAVISIACFGDIRGTLCKKALNDSSVIAICCQTHRGYAAITHSFISFRDFSVINNFSVKKKPINFLNFKKVCNEIYAVSLNYLK